MQNKTSWNAMHQHVYAKPTQLIIIFRCRSMLVTRSFSGPITKTIMLFISYVQIHMIRDFKSSFKS